uniref:RING-type domain-containing protein n=1 Tax=Globodera rostochiensis TaxID=31243 RepID=A0A914HX29_GLORO
MGTDIRGYIRIRTDNGLIILTNCFNARENFVLTQKDQKLFWNDLINFFNETKKCGPNFEEEDNDDGRKYRRRRKQFLQFVANSLEINWDGSAYLNGQKSVKSPSKAQTN